MTQEDNLLIMDNSKSLGEGQITSGLRVEILLPKSALNYQPLDLGCIANARIRYRTIFLRYVINNTIQWNTRELDFQFHSLDGRWGVNNG